MEFFSKEEVEKRLKELLDSGILVKADQSVSINQLFDFRNPGIFLGINVKTIAGIGCRMIVPIPNNIVTGTNYVGLHTNVCTY